ncbi:MULTISPECIES: SHOCT-like domain-containing protein [Caldilinea]|uniref:YvlB/LiaX N-terminal domain-containing protein n=1 Tax=Caldilinea aerophila (strain DSM 14535 / JCM 11387 / NBRC 104270 / STL-6-O1) TaxID=926550 RepID=I0I180_CALAS|nr:MULTISPECIES: hypothetical protein [Caldilinea]BAL99017.1 hypothetical protein CLDAP_09780 [Caldilinea aerophila DSM 14535 = NBRC 104270]GIV74394.1 MAG: hypothetical protein KatS3mg049_2950 [Caldilinea sp.]
MSVSRLFQIGPTPTLIVRNVSGNLSVSGWDRPEVQVRTRGEAEDLRIEENIEALTIFCEEDLWLRVPVQSTLTIEKAEANVSINLLLGSLRIGSVEGNVSLHSVSAVEIDHIEGNLTARLVAGDLHVHVVEGSVQIGKAAGDVQLDKIEGNLGLEEIGGDIQARVEGSARVRTPLAPGQQCIVQAEGNILCEVPRDVGAVFSLKAEGTIRVTDLGENHKVVAGEIVFEREPAQARLTLMAEGNIHLRGVQLRPIDEKEFVSTIEEELTLRAAELTQQISEQIEAQVHELARQLDSRLAQLNVDETLSVSIQERIQAAMRRAEERLTEALRRMEQRTQEREGRRRKGGWPSSPTPAAPSAPSRPKSSPLTEEERMMILRMVEQGKLSVDQAEQLLAALSGGKQG